MSELLVNDIVEEYGRHESECTLLRCVREKIIFTELHMSRKFYYTSGKDCVMNYYDSFLRITNYKNLHPYYWASCREGKAAVS